RRHPARRLLERELELDLARPAKGRACERLQDIARAVKIERPGEGIREWLERQHAVQPEHTHIGAQVAPADDVPPPAMVHDAIWIDRPLGLILTALIADPDPAVVLRS